MAIAQLAECFFTRGYGFESRSLQCLTVWFVCSFSDPFANAASFLGAALALDFLSDYLSNMDAGGRQAATGDTHTKSIGKRKITPASKSKQGAGGKVLLRIK